MRINNYALAEKEARESMETARAELSGVLSELDRVKSELSAQRLALGETKVVLGNVNTKRSIVSDDLVALMKQRHETYEVIGKSIEKHIEALSDIEKQVEEKKSEVLDLESQYSWFEGLNKRINEAKDTLVSIETASKRREREMELHEKALVKRMQEIEDRETAVQAESDRVDAWILAVEKREKELDWAKLMHEKTVEEFIKVRDS